MAKATSRLALVPDRHGEPKGASRQRIGDILLENGLVDRDTLDDALAAQERSGRRLGDVLVARSLISPDRLQDALAQQWSITRADPNHEAPDTELLKSVDPGVCLRYQCLPWRKAGDETILLVADPTRTEEAIRASGLDPGRTRLALCDAEPLRTYLAETFSDVLGEQARTRTPNHLSCRSWAHYGGYLAALVAFVMTLTAALTGLAGLATMFLLWAAFANFATNGLRAAAILSHASARWRRRPVPDLSTMRKLPVFSIIVPLFGETVVLDQLLEALSRINYPAENLEILLVIEGDDGPMRRALQTRKLPPTMQVVITPPDALRTKPRALNYALNFCVGDVVGIYDAEDMPEVDQLAKVARAFAESPPRVACVQARLAYYNARQNWLSRCFAIEYATWFNLLLTGYRKLGMPIPLGGTSVFFRREVLDELGGWDAYNVTEDADLGIRLARFGYVTRMVNSTTWEEANCLPKAWIWQRARWLKGYAITWLTHMRAPLSLWSDLGPRGFLGFQILFLGGLTAFLSLPVLWFAWITDAVSPGTSWLGTLPPYVILIVAAGFLAGQAVTICAHMLAVLMTRQLFLVHWVLTLPFYWPLGAIAAFKAILDLVRAPFHWDKTTHGISAAHMHASTQRPSTSSKSVSRSR